MKTQNATKHKTKHNPKRKTHKKHAEKQTRQHAGKKYIVHIVLNPQNSLVLNIFNVN